MDPIEQQIRDSLGQRAGDVESTPALWQRVDAGVARRKRRRVLAWIPAGALAVAAAIGIPLMLGGDGETPEIQDVLTVPQTQAAAMPEQLVTLSENGEVSLVDLATGEVERELGEVDVTNGAGALRALPSEVIGEPAALVGTVGEIGVLQPRVVGESLSLGLSALGDQVAGGLAVSPDGRHYATLRTPAEGAENWSLHLGSTTDPEASDSALADTVEVPAGTRLQEWTLSATGDDDSVLMLREPDGRLVGRILEADEAGGLSAWDEVFAPLGDTSVVAYAHGHLDDGSTYWLGEDGGTTTLRFVSNDEEDARSSYVELGADVGELLDGTDLDSIDLDAWGQAVVLSADTGAWLFTHDGSAFAEPVALPDGTVRAAVVPPANAQEPGDPTEEDGVTPGDDGDVTPGEGAPGVDGLPVVWAEERRVVLTGAGDDMTLMTLDEEGGSVVLDVAVRPGSTADDLTVAITTTSEGFTEIRHVSVVDGEVQHSEAWLAQLGDGADVDDAGQLPGEPITEDPLAPVSSSNADVTIQGLVWSPDGERLAWLERHRDLTGTALRTIAWGDGPGGDDPATDDIGFPAPELDGTEARLTGWPESDTSMAFQFADPTGGGNGWWVWSLAIQPDDTVAVEDSPQFFEAEPDVQAVYGVLGSSRLQRTEDGIVVAFADDTTSAAIPAAEGVPEAGARIVQARDDGALVVLEGRLWDVRVDDVTDLGAVVDAAVIE